MTYRQAYVLSRRMRASGNGLQLSARVHRQKIHSLEGDHLEETITFEGGRYGSHSLALLVNDEERVVTMWIGYCENNGINVSWVVRGQAVKFAQRRSGSRPRRVAAASLRATDERTGVIVWVTPTRCLIEYPRRDVPKRTKRQRGAKPQGLKTWRKLNEVTLIATAAGAS